MIRIVAKQNKALRETQGAHGGPTAPALPAFLLPEQGASRQKVDAPERWLGMPGTSAGVKARQEAEEKKDEAGGPPANFWHRWDTGRREDFLQGAYSDFQEPGGRPVSTMTAPQDLPEQQKSWGFVPPSGSPY